jgi:hypothetical protein
MIPWSAVGRRAKEARRIAQESQQELELELELEPEMLWRPRLGSKRAQAF